MYNRLTKKIKRLIETEAKGIMAYDLARVVQVMGVFERDAFMSGTSRQFIHSIRYSLVDAEDPEKVVNYDFEVTFREFFDEKRLLCEELMELNVGDLVFNLKKEHDCQATIEFTQPILQLLADWLSYKEAYCEVYNSVKAIERIQAEFYEEELTRKEMHAQILNEASGGLFD